MGYYDFPHTRNYDTDLGYLIKKYQELESNYQDLEEKCKAYTDEKVLESLETFRQELASAIKTLNSQYAQFKIDINLQISEFEESINKQIENIETKLAEYEVYLNQLETSMKAYTDKAVANHDVAIKEYIASQLIDMKVVNYFTGLKVTVQEMFNYLAAFHLTNGISYTQLSTRNINYTEYGEIDMTYTDLAINGYNLIPQK